MREKRGITLIALVVTIVVLLILAGVSIQMLAGEDGIIKQAVNAKDKTKEADAKEQIGVEVAGSYGIDGKISIPVLNEKLGHIEGIKGLPIASLPTIVELDGVKVVINGDGSTNNVPEYAGKTYETETDITIGNMPVTIPGGATISGIPGEYEKIDNGLVIYIIPEGEPEITDWKADTDNNGIIDVQEKYDQFVWVPVPNAIAKDKNSDGTIDTTDIDLMIADEEYPMAIATDATNYRGILYNFTLTDGKVTVSDKAWSSTSTSNREPAYLTNSSYADASGYNTVGITESSLQEEFDTMVSRVSSKKGFWVGRYETSNMMSDNTNKVKVIKGTKNGIKGTSGVKWYRNVCSTKELCKISIWRNNNSNK